MRSVLGGQQAGLVQRRPVQPRARSSSLRVGATATTPNTSAPSTTGGSKAKPADFVPKIDLSGFYSSSPEKKKEIGKALVKAAETVGFFYISGHGIPEAEIKRAFETGDRFQKLPADVKKRWPFNPNRYLGWRGPDELETVTGNRLWEWFSVGHFGLGGYDVPTQKFVGSEWPPEKELGLEGFKDVALSFQNRLHDAAITIFRAFALGLDLPEDYFDEPFDVKSEENPSFMAWNHYPPLSKEEKEAVLGGKTLPPRLLAHADMDVLTILIQQEGVTGLEIAPGSTIENPDIIEDVGNIWNKVPVARTWHTLDPLPGCLTVNVGDGFARWTDGRLKSTYHRVRAPRIGDSFDWRRSIPYFVNPKLNYVIQGPEKKYSPVTGFDLLAKTGNAYVARKDDPVGEWKKAAYGEGAYAAENAASGEGGEQQGQKQSNANKAR